jgi:ABC-type phosphate transport system substrate-binding protein
VSGTRNIEKARTIPVAGAVRLLLPLIVVFGLFATTAFQASQKDDGYRVVVNKSNPVSSMSKEEISKLFLKKTKKWKNGKKVVPIDLPQASPARATFSQEILKRTVKAVRSYWRLRAFTEGESQPPELATETEVLEYVSMDPVAIGYVSDGASLAGYSVKVIQISD